MDFGFVGSLANGVMGNLMQISENSANRRFNAKQSKLQRQFLQDMMHEQMAYNDPSAYMRRLKDAGLNPNLAVGGLSGTAPSVGSGSSASSSGSVTPQTLFDPYYKAQTDLLKSEAKKNDAEAAKVNAETPWIDKLKSLEADSIFAGINLTNIKTENAGKEGDLLVQNLENLKTQCDKLTSEIILNNDSHELNKLDISYNEFRNKYADKQFEANWQNTVASTKAAFAKAKLDEREVFELVKSFDDRLYQIQLNNRSVESQVLPIEMLQRSVSAAQIVDWKKREIESSLNALETSATVQIVNSISGAVSDIVGSLIDLKTGLSSGKKR